MKLADLIKEKYPNVPFIGFYEEDKYGKPMPIYPDYTDEILETHADREVDEVYYSAEKQTLVVKLID